MLSEPLTRVLWYALLVLYAVTRAALGSSYVLFQGWTLHSAARSWPLKDRHFCTHRVITFTRHGESVTLHCRGYFGTCEGL
jgi:hypothetical protein